MKRAFWLVLNISLLLLLLAFCMYVSETGRKLVASILSTSLLIVPDNKAVYDSWVKPPVGSVYNYYIWHVDNSDEVVNSGARPRLVQKGPYCHESRNEKVNITHSEGSVKFKVKTFYYEMDYPELDCQSLDDEITTFNVPYGMIMAMLETPAYKSYKSLAKMFLPKDWKFLMRRSAREILWGYDEPGFAKLATFGVDLPKQYGYAAGTNGSLSQLYEIDNGVENIKRVSEVKSWMEMEELNPIWRSDYSNQIRGTDGNSMPPLLEENEEVFIFVDSMCRSLNLRRVGAVMLGDETVETWKYVLPAESLLNGDVDPVNGGFCIGPDGSCTPSGTLDLSSCINATVGIPIPMLISKPHFMHGDASLRTPFDGLEPDEEKHQTALYAEPLTGLILKAAKRLQLNMHFDPAATEETRALAEGGIMPLYIIEQTFEANESLLTYVKDNIVTKLLIIYAAPLWVVLLGMIGSSFALALGIAIHLKEKTKIIRDNQPVQDKLLS